MATRSSSASMVNFHVKLACASIACLASVTAQAAVELHSQVIRPGFSVISGAGGNVVVWSGADGVVLVDTGLAESSAVLVEAVTRIAPGRVRFVLNTNGHSDHTGGNEAFARGGATVIGHESLREYAGRDPATAVAGAEGPAAAVASRPTLTTTDTLALHLNGDRLDAVHVSRCAHGCRHRRPLDRGRRRSLGDIYWSGQYPYIDVESGGSLAGTVAAIEAALARSNSRTVVVPGHGPVSNRAELAVYRDMLVAVGRRVREAVEQGTGIEDLLASRPTAEFDARFDRPGNLVTATSSSAASIATWRRSAQVADRQPTSKLMPCASGSVRAPVDRVRLPSHVGFPRVRAGLPSAAGVLLAAERAADLGARRADVDVGDAAVGAGRREEALGVCKRSVKIADDRPCAHGVLQPRSPRPAC